MALLRWYRPDHSGKVFLSQSTGTDKFAIPVATIELWIDAFGLGNSIGYTEGQMYLNETTDLILKGAPNL